MNNCQTAPSMQDLEKIKIEAEYHRNNATVFLTIFGGQVAFAQVFGGSKNGGLFYCLVLSCLLMLLAAILCKGMEEKSLRMIFTKPNGDQDDDGCLGAFRKCFGEKYFGSRILVAILAAVSLVIFFYIFSSSKF